MSDISYYNVFDVIGKTVNIEQSVHIFIHVLSLYKSILFGIQMKKKYIYNDINHKLAKSGLTAKLNIEWYICYFYIQIWFTMIFSYHHTAFVKLKTCVFFREKLDLWRSWIACIMCHGPYCCCNHAGRLLLFKERQREEKWLI